MVRQAKWQTNKKWLDEQSNTVIIVRLEGKKTVFRLLQQQTINNQGDKQTIMTETQIFAPRSKQILSFYKWTGPSVACTSKWVINKTHSGRGAKHVTCSRWSPTTGLHTSAACDELSRSCFTKIHSTKYWINSQHGRGKHLRSSVLENV